MATDRRSGSTGTRRGRSPRGKQPEKSRSLRVATDRDELKQVYLKMLIESHGEAWVEEHREMLDSQWESMKYQGLI